MNVGSGYEASTNGSGAATHIAPPTPSERVAALTELVRDRPEVMLGAAFASGVLAALLLRRLGR